MIDRRVQILDGARGPATTTVSALRDTPFLVFLGEPGIGKTTVLKAEAAAEGRSIIEVRALINRTVEPPAGTLFLDALDEYRAGGGDLDKVHQLAKEMQARAAPRWRLTCRSEDWQKDADIEAIRQTTAGEPIVVAQLLPLDLGETLAVLHALGEPRPGAFVDRALSMGAAGLIESPLSLKLLQRSVIADRPWPATRFALFEQAANALAHEDNKVHKLDHTRADAEAILAAAGRACLYLLTTGSRYLWRSGGLPPGGDESTYLRTSALVIDLKVMRDALRSSLFRGEGEAFEPVHRTLAEFLAGRALAEAVVGDADRAALPFGRAKALITGADGRAPTELRGLFAWFAAHLARFEADAQARDLIQTDAATVLAYGDAAGFANAERRLLFAYLDRHDPFFRTAEWGTTAVGGLAGEDLADEFRAVLHHDDGTHRLLTVFEALATGRPVWSLRPQLRAIALDSGREEWQRNRALAGWLNVPDADAARRELFDAFAGQPPSGPREAIRAELLAGLPPAHVSADEIGSVIRDFALAPDDNTVMRLWGLRQTLVAHPRPDLFDAPVRWQREPGQRKHVSDAEGLVDHALAAAIRTTPDLDSPRLWRWLFNTREDRWQSLGEATRSAVRGWLEADPARELALFRAILATDDPAEGPWMVGIAYFTVAGVPSGVIIDDLIAHAQEAGAARHRLLEISVSLTLKYNVALPARWRLYAYLVDLGRDGRRLLKALTYCALEPWQREEYARKRRQAKTETASRLKHLAALREIIPGLAAGENKKALAWAAGVAFKPAERKDDQRSGLERLAAEVDDEIMPAVLAGWRRLALEDVAGVTPVTLGEMELSGQHFFSEPAALAGLLQLQAEPSPPQSALPLTLALVGLRTGWITGPKENREAIEAWAWQRLNLDPAAGADALLELSETVLAGGGASSSLWHKLAHGAGSEAAKKVVAVLLERYPGMALEPLRALVAVAGRRLDQPMLRYLATAALAVPTLPAKQLALWCLVTLALDPIQHQDSLAGLAEDDLLELFSGLSGVNAFDGFGARDGVEQVALATAIFAAVAPYAELWVEIGQGRARQEHRLSDVANGMLRRLSGAAAGSAGPAIDSLLRDAERFPAWRPALRHAADQQAHARRDFAWQPSSARAVSEALAGRAPANAADLRAVLVDALTGLGRTLRTHHESPWLDYWNTDGAGQPTEPKVENVARNTTLTKLRSALSPYRIATILAEVQRRDGTRVDLYLASHGGRNLPVEAKRHYHPDLWTAATGQLQDYTNSEGAAGYGMLLVFWFGVDWAATPKRGDGRRPASADDVAAMLRADLPDQLRPITDVLVLDVSRPDGGASRTASARQRRGTRAAPAPPKQALVKKGRGTEGLPAHATGIGAADERG